MERGKMRVAYIMRGLPGSGKSTLAKSLSKESKDNIIHSTDSYHMTDGKYVFQPNKLGYFHELNREAFEQSCEAGREIVICDNTNIRDHEWEFYERVAKENGYEVRFVIAGEFNVDTCMGRNQHNVPYAVITKMKNCFEL